MSYSRFAVYYLPPDGPLSAFGAAWLGWDVARGCAATQLNVPDLHDITMTPGKYGFHGTLKPPFRLSQGEGLAGLDAATARIAASLVPTTCDGWELTTIGQFLALTPKGDLKGLQHIAQTCVRELDHFRAPATDNELARRRAAGLSARQETLLRQWGYPYVIEEFRFHLTLSGRLHKDDIPLWRDRVLAHLPDVSDAFVFDQIALCGERSDGCFELIHRYTLTG
ncbi:DUF1045 domain-containing protein [Planktotalea sp.]|uniref:DUF1045 domain-containing protein n=1 Tax=Planktotalea sp. TaxID=2029877 RepID=UPI003296E501